MLQKSHLFEIETEVTSLFLRAEHFCLDLFFFEPVNALIPTNAFDFDIKQKAQKKKHPLRECFRMNRK